MAPAAALIIALALQSPQSTMAQNRLNEHVAVDGRYLPEVTRTERLRSPLVPVEMRFGSEPTEGVLMGKPVDFAPSLMELPPTVWRSGFPRRPGLGYVDASLGSWLTGRLIAGIRPVNREDMTLGIRFDGSSTALYRPEDVLYRRRRLDGTLGVDFSRLSGKGGILTASAQYHLGWFNYDLLKSANSNYLNPDYEGDPASPTQTVNDISARVGYKSDRSGPLRWSAGAEFRHFSYRTLPFTAIKPTRETTVSIHGGIDGDVGLASTASDWGIGLDGWLNTYNGDYSPETNGLVSITPGWNISRPLGDAGASDFRWQARIGADIDFSFNQRAPYIVNFTDGGVYDIEERYASERFGFLHIAPDCSVSFGTERVGAYFRATGGVEQQTLASAADMDPYAVPLMTGSLPAYTPADFRIGVTLTPTAGFSARVEGRWKKTRSIYAGGLGTALINNLPWLTAESFEMDVLPYCSSYYNLHGFSVMATVEWKTLQWLEVTADASWQPQRGATGWFNGYDRPEWTAGITVGSNPWKGLRIDADWHLRAKRSATYSDALDFSRSLRLPNLSDLSFGLAYEFSPRFSIGARLTNILNRKVWITPGFTSEGFGATGGLQFLF